MKTTIIVERERKKIKGNVKEYLLELFRSFGLKGIKVHGKEIFAQCPFHMPHRNYGCFSINFESIFSKHGQEGYFYYCFSCHEQGSIVKLVAFLCSCSYLEAYKKITKHVVLEDVSLDYLHKMYERYSAISLSVALPELSELPPKAVNQQPMYQYLTQRSEQAHSILDVDYLVRAYELYLCDSGRYANRIIMPIRNINGQVVEFNNRSIDQNAKQKSLYRKEGNVGKTLHGLYQSTEKTAVVLVEGAFDMFQVVCALRKRGGCANYGVCCLMTAGITKTQAELVVSLFDKAVVCLDHDKAGLSGTEKIIKNLQHEINVESATEQYPQGKDPGICTVSEIVRAISKAKGKKPYLHYLEGIVGGKHAS